MKIFKFGGASIRDYDRIKNLSKLLKQYPDEKILIVISAMGKITNALEKVVDAFTEGRNADAQQLFEKIKHHHLTLLKYLITLYWEQTTRDLEACFHPVDQLLKEQPDKDYNFYYDQIVSVGELLSTTLITHFLEEEKLSNHWIDVRNFIKTDHTFRDGKVNWEATQKNIQQLSPLFEQHRLILTQGFIASNDSGDSITLGREGSDYTAAIFAKCLDAESVTIWKDVDGVMNADPKDFPESEVIPQLSYKEVIEMAYYGAQVIHPKTIKPLQNADIPLYVKSFLNPNVPGTVINKMHTSSLPPTIVFKKNQVLVTLQSKDFSFVEGEPINRLHQILDELKIKPNLTQNTAISLLICIDDIKEKIEKIAISASEFFEVQIQPELTLLTVRHYEKNGIEKWIGNRRIVLEQRTEETIQVLMSEN